MKEIHRLEETARLGNFDDYEGKVMNMQRKSENREVKNDGK